MYCRNIQNPFILYHISPACKGCRSKNPRHKCLPQYALSGDQRCSQYTVCNPFHMLWGLLLTENVQLIKSFAFWLRFFTKQLGAMSLLPTKPLFWSIILFLLKSLMNKTPSYLNWSTWGKKSSLFFYWFIYLVIITKGTEAAGERRWETHRHWHSLKIFVNFQTSCQSTCPIWLSGYMKSMDSHIYSATNTFLCQQIR